MAPFARHFLRGLLALAVVSVAFVGGYLVGQQDLRTSATPLARVVHRDAPMPVDARNVDFQLYWDVWSLLARDYLTQPVDETALLYGSLAGMVEGLEDPYSAFFDPKRAALFREDLSGKLEGIGAEIAIKDRQLTVVAPLPGTPAERAGLRSGDAILAIDDAPTDDLVLEEAVAKIRGERGTKVRLLIRSLKNVQPRELVIIRDVIAIESVTREATTTPRGASVAVVRIAHFNGDTVERFHAEVRGLLAERRAGLVLDLRNDPGGFLEAAITIAGAWVERKVVVQERANDGSVQEHRTEGLAQLQGVPTVVLVNGGTASAAEIVAGALQDYGIAMIVGEQTFGKGTVQHLTGLRDGSAVKLTIAEWLTPKGRSIEREGITPDVAVPFTEDDVEAKRDPQMVRAMEVLDGKLQNKN